MPRPVASMSATGVGACPRCGSSATKKPTFTWWGGLLGPKLFSHTICSACGFGFNSKTGESNTGPIAIYFVVITVLIIGAYAVAGSR